MTIITVAASAKVIMLFSVGASMATIEATAVSATDADSTACAIVESNAKTTTRARYRVVFYYFLVHYVNKVRYITEISLERCTSAWCMTDVVYTMYSWICRWHQIEVFLSACAHVTCDDIGKFSLGSMWVCCYMLLDAVNDWTHKNAE